MNWAHPWAFFKIQDGRQLQRFTMMDLFLQSLGTYLCFFSVFLYVFLCHEFNGNTFWIIKNIYHGYIPIMKHFGVTQQWPFSWKWQRITLMDWNSLVWLVNVSVWHTKSRRLMKFKFGHFFKSKMASKDGHQLHGLSKMDFLCNHLPDFDDLWVIWYVFLLLDSMEILLKTI